jgi:diguanylate cyclase (GGDEF)-like protein
LIGLLALSGVLVAGRSRRREWARQAITIDDAPDEELEGLIQRAEQSQRAADYLHIRIRHISYFIILASAAFLTALPYLHLSPGIEFATWVGLNIITLIGGVLLLFYWHGWDDEREVVLRRRIRLARERVLERRGLAVRDHQTGVYTFDYWLHSLELDARRGRRGGLPITCLVVQINGLGHWRSHGGTIVATGLLRRLGQELVNNVRARDVVCRSGEDRFAIGLIRCQPAMAGRVAERITRNVMRMVLNAQSLPGWRGLGLIWSAASLPRDGRTAIEVFRRAERALEDRISAQMPALGDETDSKVA